MSEFSRPLSGRAVRILLTLAYSLRLVAPLADRHNTTNRSFPSNRDGLNRAIDAVIFLGFLILSGVAVIAVAIVAPFILALSAIVGLFSKKSAYAGWRPAGA